MSDQFHHIRDTPTWELPRFVLDMLGRTTQPEAPVFWVPLLGKVAITKYMVLQVVAAVLVFVVFRGLAKRIQGGKPAVGLWWNFWETLALYVRDEIVRPSIGVPHHDHADAHAILPSVGVLHGGESGPAHEVSPHSGGPGAIHTAVEVGHPADKYLPFVWSVFFYVLFCNLLGAIPLLGSPTANINVTGMLAVATLVHVVFYGVQLSGVVGFFKSLVPHMELPIYVAIPLLPMIWVIEVFGLLIKHGVLAIRLFANIMAGHVVISVFLGYIAVFAAEPIWGIVMPASIIGQIGIGMLELFVAFLQAYVFALLSSLYISAAVNPH